MKWMLLIHTTKSFKLYAWRSLSDTPWPNSYQRYFQISNGNRIKKLLLCEIDSQFPGMFTNLFPIFGNVMWESDSIINISGLSKQIPHWHFKFSLQNMWVSVAMGFALRYSSPFASVPHLSKKRYINPYLEANLRRCVSTNIPNNAWTILLTLIWMIVYFLILFLCTC